MAGKFFSNFFGISDEPTATEYYAKEAPATPAKQPVVKQNNKVVSIQQGFARETGRIALFEPRIYSDVREISKQLLNGEAVIVNFSQEDEQTGRRTLDFLNGIVFQLMARSSELVKKFSCVPLRIMRLVVGSV